MATNALQVRQDMGQALEQVVVAGNLASLQPAERVAYYNSVCNSLGLNPFTKPFEYITLNGKLTLYARKDCTDQLRKIHRINVQIIARERLEDVYVVTARATDPAGRCDESIGVVAIASLKGDGLANALMKCETKAKRRVTLSIVGLGWLDETELETIPSAQPVAVNEQGEIESAAKVRLANDAQAPLPGQQKSKTLTKQDLIEKITNMWADEFDEFGDVQNTNSENINLDTYTAKGLLELAKDEHRRIEERRESKKQNQE